MGLRLLLVLGVQAAIASVAWADPPKLVLVPLGIGENVPDKGAAKFQQLLGDELKTRDDDLRWVPMPRSSGGPAAAPAPAPAAVKRAPSPEGVQALADGNRLMDDGKFEEAVEAFRKGIDVELQDPATTDFKELDYALVRLAGCFFRTGEDKKGQQALYLVARLTPGYALPDGFPPVFQHEYEKAQKRADKAAKGAVTVEGPSGSTAYVNGRDLGMVPVTQDGFVAGMNYVRVDGPHGERYGQAVELKSGTVRVKAVFSGGSSGGGPVASAAGGTDWRVGGALDSDSAVRAARLCKSADSDYVLVGFLYRSAEHRLTIAPALFSARRQGFVKLTRYEFDDEVLTANVEAFHLSDEVVGKLKAFDAPDSLPLSLGPEGSKAVAAVSATSMRHPSGSGEAKRTPAKTDTTVASATPNKRTPAVSEDDTPKAEDGEKVRILPRTSELVSGSGHGDTVDNPSGGTGEKKITSSSGGIPWWVWVAAGVAVAAAAGGGYYAYSQANAPVTATAKASW